MISGGWSWKRSIITSVVVWCVILGLAYVQHRWGKKTPPSTPHAWVIN